jgi:1,2-diacylglycerol 3-beta-galactosyltransferase
VEAIARTLGVALAGQDAQMVVVCGRNAALRDRLQNLAYPGPVRVEGFVANMAQWMRAADCLVTKAGPGTIAEALVCGLPLVLSGYVPGQETGNVAYVLDHGVGVYKPDPVEIAATVRRWLAPGSAELARMRQRAHDLARPHAALNITEALSELL